MNENLLEIQKNDEIKKVISSDMVSPPNEEFITIEALKAKFLKLQDKLAKMGEDIQDLEERLHNNN